MTVAPMRVRAVRIKFQGSLELILGFVPIPVIPEDGLRPLNRQEICDVQLGKKFQVDVQLGKNFDVQRS